MADLRPTELTGGADRAQLILVGGVVVALALVALVLLLNTALFAENIATRGLGPGPDRASAHAAFTDRATERVLRGEERIEYESWADAEENATRDVRRVEEAVRARQLQEHGALGTIETTDVNRGAVLVQNDSGREFVSEGNDANWTLATNTGGIRNYTMTVDASETLSSPTNVSDAFTVRIENGTDVWEAYVYVNSSNWVVVNVSGETCESDASTATINWTDGTLAGCTFPFATDGSGAGLDGSYTLSYRNGDEAAGTYHLVVRNSSGAVETGNFDDPGTTASPRYYHAVYSLHLAVAYEGSTTDYDTHVRAAPGESDNTDPSS